MSGGCADNRVSGEGDRNAAVLKMSALLSTKKRRLVQRTILRSFQAGVGIVLRKNPSFNGCCHSKSYDG